MREGGREGGREGCLFFVCQEMMKRMFCFVFRWRFLKRLFLCTEENSRGGRGRERGQRGPGYSST